MPVLPGADPFTAAGGPTGVLLVHGFTGTPQSMRLWGEYLAAAGLTVRAPRLPGHGTRWQEMNRTGWADWLHEVELGFSELRATCEDVFVMGLSMGGTLTIRLAELRGTEVAGIVLVNASLATERKDAKLLPYVSRVVPSLKGIASDIKAPGVTEVAYDRTPLRAAASLAELWKITRADLGRVVSPVLAYRSSVDHVVEPLSGRLLLEGVSSAEVTEEVLHDSYHVATLDNDKEAIFAGSLEFVRRHATTPVRAAGGSR